MRGTTVSPACGQLSLGLLVGSIAEATSKCLLGYALTPQRWRSHGRMFAGVGGREQNPKPGRTPVHNPEVGQLGSSNNQKRCSLSSYRLASYRRYWVALSSQRVQMHYCSVSEGSKPALAQPRSFPGILCTCNAICTGRLSALGAASPEDGGPTIHFRFRVADLVELSRGRSAAACARKFSLFQPTQGCVMVCCLIDGGFNIHAREARSLWLKLAGRERRQSSQKTRLGL